MSDGVRANSIDLNSTRDTQKNIVIGRGYKLRLQDAYLISKANQSIELSAESIPAMMESHHFLLSCINQRQPIYGINTQFGDQVGLLDQNIQNSAEIYYESISARQENLLKSHYCGLGNIVSPSFVKTAMMLRAHCLSQGFSGVTKGAIDSILNFINHDIIPVVRHYGSIGASGDLIPLSMMAAAIIGEDVDVFFQGRIMSAPTAIKLANIKTFKPSFRDGLAMINGTSFMTAIASLALYDLRRLFKQMLNSIAISLESMLVIESGYNPLVHALKHHEGQIKINDYLLDFWEGSKLLLNLDELRAMPPDDRIKNVQDFYSLRAVAQGFGPFLENLDRATIWIENEMNSVNDNPIIDSSTKKIHHNANFMGYYVTDACDVLKMNIAQASSWLHALLANLVHPRKNHHLPANLVLNPEKHNGFRPLQLLAAALAVQNRKLAQAHASFMLPTEGDNQDVNSLGTHAALDFSESVTNLERLVAILLLASVQAIELRGIHKASQRTQKIHQLVRKYSKTIVECRPMTDEIETVIQLLQEELV